MSLPKKAPITLPRQTLPAQAETEKVATMQNRVLVLDGKKQPLMPCHPAMARELLREGRAAVFRRFPFTVIMKDREGGAVQDVRLKLNPGSKVTGMALVANFARRGATVVWAGGTGPSRRRYSQSSGPLFHSGRRAPTSPSISTPNISRYCKGVTVMRTTNQRGALPLQPNASRFGWSTRAEF